MEQQADFVIEDGILIEYRGSGGDIVIPAGVTGIRGDVFSGRRELAATVVIPEGVKEIRESTFYDCIRLTGVTLPESLLSIEFHAFLDCRSLTEITIPPNVRQIGAWAFFNCKSLETITLLGARTSPAVRSEDPFEEVDAPITAPNLPLGDMPAFWKQRAVWGFALERDRYPEARQGEYLNYIKSQRNRLSPLALRRPELLLLMLGEEMFSPKELQAILEEADRQGNTAAKRLLLHCQP